MIGEVDPVMLAIIRSYCFLANEDVDKIERV